MSVENGYLQKKDTHFSTKSIHVGSEAEQWSSMAVVPPISLSTTFKQEGPAEFKVSWGVYPFKAFVHSIGCQEFEQKKPASVIVIGRLERFFKFDIHLVKQLFNEPN